MITISLCRKCCTAYLGREEIIVAHFRSFRGRQVCTREHMTKTTSNTMFVHYVVENTIASEKRRRTTRVSKGGPKRKSEINGSKKENQ